MMSKNVEGSEAFWTQAQPEPAGRARQAGRASQTLEPLDAPPVWVWAGEVAPPPDIWWECGAPAKPEPRHPELDLGDGLVLVLDGDPGPMDDLPVFHAN